MINVCNQKNENDLEIKADAYSNYYTNSVLEEKCTLESAKELIKTLFTYFIKMKMVFYIVGIKD